MKHVIMASALAIVGATAASAQTIDFDAMSTFVTVDNFYAGGTDSLGEVGPNEGIVFQGGDWAVITGYGETSQPNFAYSQSGAGSIDFLGGFSGSVSFTYGAFSDTTINIFSGLGGSGTLLASVLAPTDSPFAFSPFSISFAGLAHSFVIAGGPAQFGIDDLTVNASAAPEPASWALMLGGFGAIGGALRSRRKAQVTFA
jgi:hypothetical protein